MTKKHPESSDTRCQLRFADGRRCALPAHPQGGGLCYPHAHAPHRRLRPSDLTRELASPSGTAIPAEKIHSVLAKLPIALVDGTISLGQFRALNNLCYLMLQCSRLSATELPAYPHNHDWNVATALLNQDSNKDPNEKQDEFSLLPTNR